MLKKAMMAIEYGDVFMNVVYRTRPYEKEKGSVNALHEHWKEICIKQLTSDKVRMKDFNKNLRDIVHDFDNIELLDIKNLELVLLEKFLLNFFQLLTIIL